MFQVPMFNCEIKKGRLRPRRELRDITSLYIGINVRHIGPGASKSRVRGIKKVIIHESFSMSGNNCQFKFSFKYVI